MSEALVIVSRDGGSNEQRRLMEEAVASRMSRAGISVLLTPPLHHLAEDDIIWSRLADRFTPATAVLSWIHPRPMEWIAGRHGWDRATHVLYFDLRVFDDAATCVEHLFEFLPAPGQGDSAGIMEDWSFETIERWYPVIDYSRCTDCRQCLQFCLFSVYSLDDDGKTRVTEPDNCKPGCPACSRICPSSAIMFPLCDTDEAIAGAPGCFVKPDSKIKAAYYARTGVPCPLCGQTYRAPSKADTPAIPVCRECGMAQETVPPNDAAGEDDLDQLIRELEELKQR